MKINNNKKLFPITGFSQKTRIINEKVLKSNAVECCDGHCMVRAQNGSNQNNVVLFHVVRGLFCIDWSPLMYLIDVPLRLSSG